MTGSCGRLAVMIGMTLVVAASGCGKKQGEFVPVAGTVKLEGLPLSVGAVSFRPDESKGNQSMHIPTGQIDGQGRFELVSSGIKGAPPGWYKVLVFADANDLGDPNRSRPPIPKWLMNEKYTEPGTTPLSIEVVEKPVPGAYDFNVTK